MLQRVLKIGFNRAARIMDQLAEELDFPFKRCGKVLVGNTPEDMEQLERTMKQGAVNGCTGLEMIDEAKLHELVPAVVGKFAMWSKNSGIMDPFLYTVALAENAHANSVDFFFDHKVEAILPMAISAPAGWSTPLVWAQSRSPTCWA